MTEPTPEQGAIDLEPIGRRLAAALGPSKSPARFDGSYEAIADFDRHARRDVIELLGEVLRLRAQVAVLQAETDRLGVLDSVLKERRHHPNCPAVKHVESNGECDCWLAAVLPVRYRALEAQVAAQGEVIAMLHDSKDVLHRRLNPGCEVCARLDAATAAET